MRTAKSRGSDELRKRILGKLVETAYKRHKLYNMPMPELEQMAADAGVSLQEAMGDVKQPCGSPALLS